MPSGRVDLKGLKDFKAHLTLAGEAISRASRPRKPNWIAGSGRPFWEFFPTSVGPLKPGNCAIFRRVRVVSLSDSEYVPSGSCRVLSIAPGLRASSLFSLAASAPFSMSEQKEVQLLFLASLISFLYASLVALDKFHSSSALPFLARLNLSLVSLRSFSSFPFHQWVSRAFLIFEGKQLSSYVVMMADENWSAALSRASTSLISMVFPWGAACRSVE